MVSGTGVPTNRLSTDFHQQVVGLHSLFFLIFHLVNHIWYFFVLKNCLTRWSTMLSRVALGAARAVRQNAFKHSVAAFSTSGATLPNDPVIVSFARTPVASFQGDFASMTAPQLASIAV